MTEAMVKGRRSGDGRMVCRQRARRAVAAQPDAVGVAASAVRERPHFDDLGCEPVLGYNQAEPMSLYPPRSRAGGLPGSYGWSASWSSRAISGRSKRGISVHSPPRTAHTIVAGSQPALVLGVGARKRKGKRALSGRASRDRAWCWRAG